MVPGRISARVTSHLVNLLRQCAADTRFWPEFLADLSEATHSTHAVIVVQCSNSSVRSATAFIGINPKSAEVFQDTYCRYCESKPCKVAIRNDRSLPAEALVWDSQRMCLNTAGGTGPKTLRAHSTRFLKGKCCTATLNVFRRRGGKRFEEKELTLLSDLVPCLENAAEINRTISCLLTENNAAWNVMDRIPIGVILVNEAGKILMMNHNARAIMEEDDGISVSRDQTLFAARNDETRALHRLIAEAAAGTISRVGTVLRLTRPSARRSLSLAVIPIHSKRYFLQCGKPAAAIYISDPEHAMETKANALRRFYDLTPAEARIASLLTQGRSLKLVARDLHITYGSARNHLKHIFMKTGTSRQSELVRLLLSSPAAINDVRS